MFSRKSGNSARSKSYRPTAGSPVIGSWSGCGGGAAVATLVPRADAVLQVPDDVGGDAGVQVGAVGGGDAHARSSSGLKGRFGRARDRPGESPGCEGGRRSQAARWEGPRLHKRSGAAGPGELNQSVSGSGRGTQRGRWGGACRAPSGARVALTAAGDSPPLLVSARGFGSGLRGRVAGTVGSCER